MIRLKNRQVRTFHVEPVRTFHPDPVRTFYAEPVRTFQPPIASRKYLVKLIKQYTRKPRISMMALLIAAHNEELVIGDTINSAIKAGMEPKNIYVVDDNSSDKTGSMARSILGKTNVCRVRRSGKGLALTKAAKKFDLVNRYRWIHIADADGGFAPNYFAVFRRELRVKNAAATGYVKSLPGGAVSQYRVYEYTIGMEIHRRFQALTHTVPVIPGPTSCFRSDVFSKLNFANKSITEDFDVTLQIHRQKLGRIQFIPGAIAYTQEPKNARDYSKQVTRWSRGTIQGVIRHKIGRKPTRIDLYLSYQVMQNFLFFFNYCILMPIIAIRNQSGNVLATTFLYDVIITLALTIIVAAKSKRWDILSAYPHIYILRWLALYIFLRSFVEVAVLRRFRVTEGIWSTAGRRYKQSV